MGLDDEYGNDSIDATHTIITILEGIRNELRALRLETKKQNENKLSAIDQMDLETAETYADHLAAFLPQEIIEDDEDTITGAIA